MQGYITTTPYCPDCGQPTHRDGTVLRCRTCELPSVIPLPLPPATAQPVEQSDWCDVYALLSAATCDPARAAEYLAEAREIAGRNVRAEFWGGE